MDAGIIDSSLWVKDHDVLRVWIALLAKSDSYGYVRVAAPAMARLCNIERKRYDEIIDDLCAPDPDSRTPDNDGRRLEVIDGGYQILNYELYRNAVQKKPASAAERARKYRERKKLSECVTDRHVERSASRSSRDEITSGVTRSQEAEADTEAERENPPLSPPGGGGVTSECREAFETWKSTLPAEARDRVKLTKQRRTKYSARRREGYTHEQILAAVTNYVHDPWEGRLANATARDFATLLRDGGQVEKFAAMRPGQRDNGRGSKRPRLEPDDDWRQDVDRVMRQAEEETRRAEEEASNG